MPLYFISERSGLKLLFNFDRVYTVLCTVLGLIDRPSAMTRKHDDTFERFLEKEKIFQLLLFAILITQVNYFNISESSHNIRPLIN